MKMFYVFKMRSNILLLLKCLPIILILNVNIYIRMVITLKYYLAIVNKILLCMKVYILAINNTIQK